MVTRASNPVLNLVDPPIDDAVFVEMVAETATIQGGSIDGATVGATVPNTGTFTSVTDTALAAPLVGAPSGLLQNVLLGPGLAITNNTLTLTALLPISGTTDFYVDVNTGSDSNSGQSAGQAWRTIQHAWNWIQANLNLQGFAVVVHIAAGTYAPANFISLIIGVTSSASVTFRGNVDIPSSVVIEGTTTNALTIASLASCTIEGVTFRALNSGSGQGYGLVVAYNAICAIANVRFERCDVCGMDATAGGYIAVVGSYTVAGSGLYHMIADQGTIEWGVGSTPLLVVEGTPTFNAFALAELGGSIRINYATTTILGSCLGTRYIAEYNGIIDTLGSPTTYFPGSISGITSTGGYYL